MASNIKINIRQKWMNHLWIKSKKTKSRKTKKNQFLEASTKNDADLMLSPTSVDSSTRETESHVVMNDQNIDAFLNNLSTPKLDDGETLKEKPNENDNGYAAVSPDSEKYGYGEAVPDSEKGLSDKENFYERNIGDTFKSSHPPIEFHRSASQRIVPKRSSMKKLGSPPRRVSIQLCEEFDDNGRPTLKRKTSITFNNVLKVRAVIPAKQLTDEPQTLWFQPDEFSKIKKSCFAIVDQVEQGTSKKFCTRGLERYFANTRRESMERRHSALDSVLDEQRHHRRRDSLVDDEQMARLYKFSTFQNRRDAFVRAKQDELEIKKYLRK